jgi:hypothetical protein
MNPAGLGIGLLRAGNSCVNSAEGDYSFRTFCNCTGCRS